MRALAPLPATFLLAASAAACPFGYPGHAHQPAQAAASGAASPLPAGRCDGAAAAPEPPRAGALLDLRAEPIPADDLDAWSLLGYRPDASGRRFLGPDGAPLSKEGLAFLNAPWNAAEERVSVDNWNSLMLQGYRLDESSCRLLGPDHKPASRAAVAYVKASTLLGLQLGALERLLAALRSLPPDAPIPDGARAIVRQVSAAGVPLPEEIRAVLDRPFATVGQLRGPASATYQGLTDYFDGQMPLGDAAALVLPARGGPASRRAAYRDPVEQAMGRLLQAAFHGELARNPVGADLLARFDRNRRQGLPNVIVLKLSQRPEDSTQGAIYDPSSDTMIINHWIVADAVRRNTPPERRAALEPLLSDPARLLARVSGDAGLLKAVVADIDIEYFHELLHAQQSRRSRLDDELLRGNTPWANPLDKEREAHREHCRYLLAKAPYAPAAVHESRWRDYCLGMLRDPDAFQDGVTRLYLSTFGGSAAGPELAGMQEARRDAARNPAGDWRRWARRLLRRAGLSHGDEALAEFSREARALDAAFNARVPALRVRTASQMAEGMKGRPDAVLLYLALDPQWTRSPRAEPAVAAAVAWVLARKDEPGALHDRLAVENLVNAWLAERRKAPSPAFHAAVRSDFRAAAESYLAQASKATGAARAQALTMAEAYAASLNDRALLARIRARRSSR